MSLIKCEECGKEISEKASTCPNCGNPINIQNKNSLNTERKTSGFAISGFVIGLVSMLIDPFAILGILSVVFSSIGLANVKNKGQKGKGFAITGLILGIIAIAWFILKIIYYWDEFFG